MSATMYKRRDKFSSADDYAVYVRENIAVGMRVRCCQTYEEVHEGDVGTVVKVSTVSVPIVTVITTLRFFHKRRKYVTERCGFVYAIHLQWRKNK